MAEEREVFKKSSTVNMWSLKRLNQIVRSKIRLNREEDEIATIREIWEGVNLSGYNFWIMGFAMVIACIGLNTNSLSAIIGAMLISPLMGPVTGYAFALATRDRLMRNSAIRNFLWMTGISLAASTLFFLISPFDNNTDALMAFSKASIFDILIAFFGGMAGFVGIMKRDGIKVIAGVAVATACMPPLCTAGFGLAHGIWIEFIGGLYFYTINSLFIGLATFFLARITGFRAKPNAHLSLHKSAAWLWGIFIGLMIAPGIYIGWQKWKLEKNADSKRETKEQIRIHQLEQKVNQLDSMIQSQYIEKSSHN
jgi:uncharacterized hydrophobic protein (TIGR00271 family)